MSWRQKTMTGVEDCEKLGVAVKQALIPSREMGFRSGSANPGRGCGMEQAREAGRGANRREVEKA
jgi:hypothetical protein